MPDVRDQALFTAILLYQTVKITNLLHLSPILYRIA